MTLEEKLNLPCGQELDTAIANDLRGSSAIHRVPYSTSDVGRHFLHDCLQKWGVSLNLCPQSYGSWIATVDASFPQYAFSPLLASWRSALEWYHKKGQGDARTGGRMTRDEALEMQEALFPGQQTLLDICQHLRTACNGASDPWPEELVAKTREMLAARLHTWEHRTLRLFDAAVYFLVQATLAETEDS